MPRGVYDRTAKKTEKTEGKPAKVKKTKPEKMAKVAKSTKASRSQSSEKVSAATWPTGLGSAHENILALAQARSQVADNATLASEIETELRSWVTTLTKLRVEAFGKTPFDTKDEVETEGKNGKETYPSNPSPVEGTDPSPELAQNSAS